MDKNIIYSRISITDKDIFINTIELPNGICSNIEYHDNGMATLTLMNIEERLVKKVKRELNTIKALHYSNRLATNLGSIGASLVKGTLKGSKKFASEINKELQNIRGKIEED